ncbi:hypothetical protein VA7868_00694 [Vibrio aerogenes CECT 7868]|uniref:Uncharacterized protein n=1 Tax=Vibrio aerogenes CECT 7868 TaxID=1216006 RepID=A0A1M5WDY4_9VIBR|nr:hypothetical protein [Vibrio aerogenes]SHH85598.1 hypothetical protein VA7868_00694 [Vibrio aerogenes CECT 7868]
MSAKFTYLAWQFHTQTPVEKLVLLMLADSSDQQGVVLLDLEQAAPLCSLSTYALADCLTNLAQQGLIEKEGLERRKGKEIHIFRIMEKTEQPAPSPVQQQPAEVMLSNPPSSSIGQVAPSPTTIPEWAKKELSFNGINSQIQQQIWDTFTSSIDFSQLSCTPLARLERHLQNWLQEQGQNKQKQFSGSPDTKSQHRHAMNHFTKPVTVNQNDRQEFVSTHDLDEYEIPSWAEKAFRFSAVTTDHQLIWQKFVLWHKSKANELLAVSKLENKLKYWLANEKLNEDRKTRTQGHSGTAEQTQGDGHRRKLSPSERFRQQLIQQGKKPTF